VELETLGRARELLARWVQHYNEGRLHAALFYLPPAEYYHGDPEARLECSYRCLSSAHSGSKRARLRSWNRDLAGTPR